MAKPRKKNLRILGVIPARLGSQRLARKVLREIRGQLLIEHVYRRVKNSPLLDELWIATDSEEVKAACEKRGLAVLLTSPQHTSGTDRIHEVMKNKKADIYVNIQGDEPLVRPEHIKILLEPFFSRNDVPVATLKTRMETEAAANPNVVKVVTNQEGWALYFSRARIPFNRDAMTPDVVYKHLGFYAYTAEALEKFRRLPSSQLEQMEKLEQLRLIENGIPIFVSETVFDTIGVDTEEDLQRAAELLAKETKSRKTFRAKASMSGKKQGV